MSLKSLKYKILKNITFGKTKQHYKTKYKKIKTKETKYTSWCLVIEDNSLDVSYFFKKYIDAFRIPHIDVNQHIIFDINMALKLNPKIKKIGFIFFMGIGDYFYTTRFFEALKIKYPQLSFDAYVSKNFDGNNSPLVADCLKKNPNFENVFYYNGKPNKNNWKNYDYIECYKIKKDDVLLLPVIYQHNASVISRNQTLCETYKLDVPYINLPPIIYDYQASVKILNIFEKYKNYMDKVVFVQLTARSSHYTYEYVDEIITKLLNAGFFVITVEKTKLHHNKLLKLNIKDLLITETISLLQLIKNKGVDLSFITVISCFATISAAMGIPNLVLHHFYDVCLHSVYFSNMFIIANKNYSKIPSDRQFLCPQNEMKADYEADRFTYKPEFVWKCFCEMKNILSLTQKN